MDYYPYLHISNQSNLSVSKQNCCTFNCILVFYFLLAAKNFRNGNCNFWIVNYLSLNVNNCCHFLCDVGFGCLKAFLDHTLKHNYSYYHPCCNHLHFTRTLSINSHGFFLNHCWSSISHHFNFDTCSSYFIEVS